MSFNGPFPVKLYQWILEGFDGWSMWWGPLPIQVDVLEKKKTKEQRGQVRETETERVRWTEGCYEGMKMEADCWQTSGSRGARTEEWQFKTVKRRAEWGETREEERKRHKWEKQKREKGQGVNGVLTPRLNKSWAQWRVCVNWSKSSCSLTIHTTQWAAGLCTGAGQRNSYTLSKSVMLCRKHHKQVSKVMRENSIWIRVCIKPRYVFGTNQKSVHRM